MKLFSEMAKNYSGFIFVVYTIACKCSVVLAIKDFLNSLFVF